MKLLIDMNLSPRWVGFLDAAGFESAHWSDIGSVNASDQVIMEVARESGFVILTHDLDFGAILAATGGNAPSVVQIRSDDLRIETIGSQIVGALRQAAEILEQGALVTVDARRTRISVLPIGESR
jgi:predicted nuclease of predicted toxin-antitoxin system